MLIAPSKSSRLMKKNMEDQLELVSGFQLQQENLKHKVLPPYIPDLNTLDYIFWSYAMTLAHKENWP